MKKLLLNAICLVLCLLMMLSFASCDSESQPTPAPTPTPTEKPFEPATVQELWNKINETMEALESYESKGDMQMTVYNVGMKIDTVSTVTSVFYIKEGNEFSYIDSEVKMTCKEASLDETYKNVVAFYNGKMYIQNKTGDFDQKFCSTMTYTDFLVAQSDRFISDIDMLGCTDASFSKNDDGTWSLDFSGYTKKVINAFLKESEITEKDLGGDIVDMEINVLADSAFLATKVTIKLVFDNDENSTTTPALSMVTEYSKHDAVEPDYTVIKTEEYVEVADVRILDKVEDGIENIENAKNADFELEVKETTEAFGNKNTYTEKDTISFGEENGGYYYNITAKTDQATITISYKNGVQTYKQGGQSQSAEMTDDTARSTIKTLINHAGFNKLAVSAIEKTGENVYKFTIGQPEATAYKQYFANNGVTFTSATQTIIVTMDGDNVKKVESKLVVKGSYKSGSTTEVITMTAESTNTYNNVAQIEAEL